jgi:hypothetical protein
MEERHVVSALVNKRAEIAGMIATLPSVYLLPEWNRS